MNSPDACPPVGPGGGVTAGGTACTGGAAEGDWNIPVNSPAPGDGGEGGGAACCGDWNIRVNSPAACRGGGWGVGGGAGEAGLGGDWNIRVNSPCAC
ncbi:MAG TPA: hypothetical protein VLW65_18330 [Bryobacteraceae bacterium]|nr:hypothetical protein [Bryobacteraceae bacterium]